MAFNEAETIHFTIKHYQRFCDKITIWDNFSTDATSAISLSMGCQVEKFGLIGQLNDGEYTTLKNNCWKRSTADLVIMCDADEILLAPPEDLGNFTVWPMVGYNMFSEELPKEDWLECNMGIEDGNYAKSIIFSPMVKDMNFQPGAHQCKPRFIRQGTETLTVCHFKHIGGVQRVLDRNKLYRSRLSNYNRVHQFGIQYSFQDEKVIEYFNSSLQNSKRLW